MIRHVPIPIPVVGAWYVELGHPVELDESEMLTSLRGCRADSGRDKHGAAQDRAATKRVKNRGTFLVGDETMELPPHLWLIGPPQGERT